MLTYWFVRFHNRLSRVYLSYGFYHLLVYIFVCMFVFSGNVSRRDNAEGSSVRVWWDLCSTGSWRIRSFSAGHVSHLWGLIHRMHQHHSVHQYPQVRAPYVVIMTLVCNWRFLNYFNLKVNFDFRLVVVENKISQNGPNLPDQLSVLRRSVARSHVVNNKYKYCVNKMVKCK